VIYLGTNIIIAYMDESDPNHSKAQNLLDKLEDKRIVSKLTQVELASVYARADLKDPLALAIYSIKTAGASVAEVNFNEVITQASKLSHQLKLRTLDLLHITVCKLIGSEYFATFDKDVITKSDKIKKIGVRVIKEIDSS
jgi:predicted nucleic acid-binding protein